jgi:protein-disulfide isomerase
MNAPRSSWSTPSCSALALGLAALLAVPGCIGKRRPRGDQEQATTTTTASSRVLIQPEDVDGKHDALVEGTRVRATYDEQDPATGAALPLVTIVEYSDFQCPFCSKLASTLEEVAGEHDQEVKLVFKQFPLPMHPQAEPAARAALAAHQQGKFWAMHDKMFANQRALSNEDLEAYARGAGLDMERWRKDFESDALRQHVREEMDLGRALGVGSTPTYFINGRFFKGAQPPEVVRAAIEEELLAARKLLDAGVPRPELYARFLHPAPALEAPKAPQAEAEPPKPAQPGVPADAKPDPDHVAGEASKIPNYGVPVGNNRPSRGPADALVTIVQFGALDCEACRSVQPILDQLLAKHPGDVRLVFRHLAESVPARRSAQIAQAAHKQGKFWEAHARLLANEGEFDPASAEQLAKDLGLDTAAFMHDLRDRSEGGPLQQIQEDAAVVDVFRGTAPAPVFFVNGRYLDSTATLDDFERLVEEEKAKAKAFMADKGVTDKATLYEAMVKTWRGYERALNPPPAEAAP